LNSRETLEPLFIVLIPEIDDSVASNRSESSELRMEGDVIDGVDAVFYTMAFKGKRFPSSYLLNVVDADAAFDAADGEARHVGEGGYAAGLKLEGGFFAAVFSRGGLDVVADDVTASACYL